MKNIKRLCIFFIILLMMLTFPVFAQKKAKNNAQNKEKPTIEDEKTGIENIVNRFIDKKISTYQEVTNRLQKKLLDAGCPVPITTKDNVPTHSIKIVIKRENEPPKKKKKPHYFLSGEDYIPADYFGNVYLDIGQKGFWDKDFSMPDFAVDKFTSFITGLSTKIKISAYGSCCQVRKWSTEYGEHREDCDLVEYGTVDLDHYLGSEIKLNMPCPFRIIEENGSKFITFTEPHSGPGFVQVSWKSPKIVHQNIRQKKVCEEVQGWGGWYTETECYDKTLYDTVVKAEKRKPKKKVSFEVLKVIDVMFDDGTKDGTKRLKTLASIHDGTCSDCEHSFSIDLPKPKFEIADGKTTWLTEFKKGNANELFEYKIVPYNGICRIMRGEYGDTLSCIALDTNQPIYAKVIYTIKDYEGMPSYMKGSQLVFETGSGIDKGLSINNGELLTLTPDNAAKVSETIVVPSALSDSFLKRKPKIRWEIKDWDLRELLGMRVSIDSDSGFKSVGNGIFKSTATLRFSKINPKRIKEMLTDYFRYERNYPPDSFVVTYPDFLSPAYTRSRYASLFRIHATPSYIALDDINILRDDHLVDVGIKLPVSELSVGLAKGQTNILFSPGSDEVEGIKLNCSLKITDHTLKFKYLPKCVRLISNNKSQLTKKNNSTLIASRTARPGKVEVRGVILQKDLPPFFYIKDGSKRLESEPLELNIIALKLFASFFYDEFTGARKQRNILIARGPGNIQLHRVKWIMNNGKVKNARFKNKGKDTWESIIETTPQEGKVQWVEIYKWKKRVGLVSDLVGMNNIVKISIHPFAPANFIEGNLLPVKAMIYGIGNKMRRHILCRWVTSDPANVKFLPLYGKKGKKDSPSSLITPLLFLDNGICQCGARVYVKENPKIVGKDCKIKLELIYK